MDSLTQDLQRTIASLEAISEKRPSEALDEILDQLYQQKIDLQNVQPSPGLPALQQCAQALKAAAVKAELAVREPSRNKEMVAAVQEAIGKIAKLLDQIIHID